MLNFALVGCGRIAKRHSELLGMKQIDGARLSAVCDIVPEKAKAIGDQTGVPDAFLRAVRLSCRRITAIFGPQPQGSSGYFVTLAQQQQGSCTAVHAAAHAQ